MKKVISIGLIFLLSAQCFYKLGLITYYQLNRDYIAEVLCINKEKPITMCHGQCFLNRNLDLSEESEGTPASPGKEKVDIPFFLISRGLNAFNALAKPAIMHSAYLRLYTSGYLTVPFHPPALG